MRQLKILISLSPAGLVAILLLSVCISCNNKASLQFQLEDAVKDFHGQVGKK